MSNDKQYLKTLTAKDTRIVTSWKVTDYAGIILFLAVVPRSMGPEVYGNFAIILSILGLLLLSSALGGVPMFGRFVPGYLANNQQEKINGLFTQFFFFRMLLAMPFTVLFSMLLTYLRPEMSTNVVWVAALAYLLGTISMSCSQLFFGLNRMGLWLFHDSSNRLLLVILLAVYWPDFDLKHAVFSLAIIELILVCPALFWAREYFNLRSAIQQLSMFIPHLKFGLTFLASNVLFMMIWRSGEVIIISFSGESDQAAFYNLANSIFLAFNALFGQIAAILIPSVSALHASGLHEKKEQWLGYILKYITVATVLALIVINAISEPVLAMLLGQGFSEVTTNLLIISISLLPLNLVRLGLTTAVVHNKLRGNLLVAGVAMVSFLISTMLLTPEMGAKGVSISVVISSFSAAIFAYWHLKLSSITQMADFGKIAGIGSIFIGFVMFSGYSPIATGITSILAFTSLLLLLRIVRVSELVGLIIDKNKKSRTA